MAEVELPSKYKAAIYDNPGEVSTQIIEKDLPEPGPGDVLIKLTHSGVCYSDLSVMTQTWKGLPAPTPKGIVGGHEGVGTIVKLGPDTERSGMKVGQRVGIKWVAAACGGCPTCLEGHDALCINQKVSGYSTNGTFQQYVTSQATYVTPIPEGLPSEIAAPLLCGGLTVYSGLRKSGAKSGEFVVLLGAGGGLGHIGCQIAAKSMGLRVIGIDAGSKEDIVKESGAEFFIDFSPGPEHVLKEVQKATGGFGAHAVLVLTGSNAAYGMAVDLLRFGGTLCCIGLPAGEFKPIEKAYPSLFVTKVMKIIGVAVGNRAEAKEVLDLAKRGVIKTHVEVVPLDKLQETFQKMKAGELKGRVVLDLQQ